MDDPACDDPEKKNPVFLVPATNAAPESTVSSAYTSNQATKTTTPEVTPSRAMDKSMTVVQIYEEILQVTKQQHALDSQPEADVVTKAALANELAGLYKQLNDLNLDAK